MTPVRACARSMVGAVLFVLAVAAIYTPGLNGDFAFDDFHVIVENATLRLPDWQPATLLDASLSTATGPLLRPLSMFSFALNRTWFGPDPFSFKLTNLALHTLNALLVLVVLRRLLPQLVPGLAAPRAALLAWGVALAWALHPINLSAVLYAVQRMTLLATTCMLLGLIVYLQARAGKRIGDRLRWPVWLAIGSLLVLGLMAKETAILLLPFLLCVEAHVFQFGGNRRRARQVGTALALLLVAAVAIPFVAPAEVWLDYSARSYTLAERLLTECRVLWRYLGMMVWPDPGRFALFHDDIEVSTSLFTPPTTLPAVLGVGAIVFAAVRGRPRWLAFGAGWFMAAHLLESTIFPLELMHEHRNYLAVLGVLLAGGIALESARGLSPSMRTAFGATAVLMLALLTWQRAILWSDPLQQMTFEAEHHPLSPSIHYDLGRLQIERGSTVGNRDLIARGHASIARAAELSPWPLLPLSTQLKLAVNAADADAIDTALERIAPFSPGFGARVLKFLVQCQVDGLCRAEPRAVMRLAELALGTNASTRDSTALAVEWLAVFYLRILGDTDAGLALLSDIVADYPQNLALRMRFAEALVANERATEAAAQLTTLRRAMPWHSPVSNRPLYRRLRALDGARS